MVSRWIRVVYSGASVATGIVCYAAFNTIWMALAGSAETMLNFLWSCFLALVLCSMGWLLALPIVLTVSRIDGCRFWGLFALGSAIGPLVIFGLSFWGWIESGAKDSFDTGETGIACIALGVAMITTFVYLLLVHRAQERVEN